VADVAALAGAVAMGNISRLIRSAKRIRIVFICPHCGLETPEFVERLRGESFYSCRGEGCDYHFDLKSGPHKALVEEVSETCARLDAAFSAVS
jgi:hypothetical protein